MINQKCIRNHEIDFRLSRRNDTSLKRVPEERLIQVGDVLINSTGTGTLGRVAQVREIPSEPTTVDTHVTIVRPISSKFYDDFFGYCLIEIEKQLIDAGQGSVGQIELSKRDVQTKFKIKYPTDREEQRRIVAILDEAFEGLKTAQANAEANLASAEELFEASLKTDFANLCENVQHKLLREVALDFGRGRSRHRPRNAPELYDGPYPFIQTGEVRNSQRYINNYEKTYNDNGLRQSKLWPKNTLCITIAANIAETGILSMQACFPDSVIGMVCDPEATFPEYVELMLNHYSKQLKAQGGGTAQDNINLATFEGTLLTTSLVTLSYGSLIADTG